MSCQEQNQEGNSVVKKGAIEIEESITHLWGDGIELKYTV
jgi:hypothetical protein